MYLNRKTLFSNANNLIKDMEDSFSDLFNDCRTTDSRRHLTKDGNLIVEIDVPGISVENLNVSCTNTDYDYLITIKGEQKSSTKLISFNKTFNVSHSFNTENISVELQNGVLTFNFFKKEKSDKKVHKINVIAK